MSSCDAALARREIPLLKRNPILRYLGNLARIVGIFLAYAITQRPITAIQHQKRTHFPSISTRSMNAIPTSCFQKNRQVSTMRYVSAETWDIPSYALCALCMGGAHCFYFSLLFFASQHSCYRNFFGDGRCLRPTYCEALIIVDP